MTRSSPVLERLREQYQQAGLRPLVDAPMHMLVTDCPACRAQDDDPAGIYRPVRVVPRNRKLTILCMAFGRNG
jgi:hypothetical protein